MQVGAVYPIFWLPNGYGYEAGNGNVHYENVVIQFLQDVGGTPFYNILTQYSYGAHSRTVRGGPIPNRPLNVHAYLDTQPYGHIGTAQNPLDLGDIRAEMTRLWRAHVLAPGLDRLYIVFLAANVQLCLQDGCTFAVRGRRLICSLHSSMTIGGNHLVFAVLPNIYWLKQSLNPCRPLATRSSPSSDPVVDSEIPPLGHELFEAITDPLIGPHPRDGAWYGKDGVIGEIADKCQALERVITLHTHPYRVQAEWSNEDHACVFRRVDPLRGGRST